jgi:hypothetical protein
VEDNSFRKSSWSWNPKCPQQPALAYRWGTGRPELFPALVTPAGTDAQMIHAGISGAQVLEPALRMKAQADSRNRGWKDFICREKKRKTA